MRKKLSAWLPRLKEEKGAVNIAGILMMGIGMVFLAVGFIMFPIVTDATDDLLDYSYTTNTTITDATFTGFTDVIGITPLLVLLGFVSAAVFAMYLGVRIQKTPLSLWYEKSADDTERLNYCFPTQKRGNEECLVPNAKTPSFWILLQFESWPWRAAPSRFRAP